jgi:GNAT superfamily N-acetyltransferase
MAARPPRTPTATLEVVNIFLEMRKPPPPRSGFTPPHRKLALLRAEEMPVHFYRYLYEHVGEPWLWYERRLLDDRTLAAIVQDDKVEIYVLYAGGAPAGFAELDRRKGNEIELAYLGVMPERIGQGLGRYLLEWAVEMAWAYAPERLWLHTCNLDHPRALQYYQKLGFVPYRQETKRIEDPRATGVIPGG